MSDAPPESEPTGPHNEQTATGDSHVTGMINVVHGDVSFYTLDGHETPEEMYRVGRNYLDGNMPREAEKLICRAFMSGHRSIQVAYYWALAVLSNRSFDHLTEENFGHLEQAFEAVKEYPPDPWWDALGVVAELVQSLIAQEQQIDPNPEAFDGALHRYGQLPFARRDEVRRHLEMVLAGGIQDQLEEQDAVEVAQKRMGGDRRHRVWKFFEPQPKPPRMLRAREPEPASEHTRKLVAGCALALLCAVLGGEYLLGGNPFLFAVALLLYAGGAYLLVRYGVEQRVLAARAVWTGARLRGHFPDGTIESTARSSLTAAFAAGIARLLAVRFDEHVPDNDRDASTWRSESAGIRASIVREIVEQYSDVTPLPRIAALDWLARWHADSTFERWKKGELFESRRRVEPPREMVTRTRGGAAMVIVSVLLTGVNASTVGWFLGPLITAGWGVAAVLMWTGGTALRERAAVADAQAEEFHRRHLAESKAFAKWQEDLRDQPSDAEMATWLDYDKAHVKAAAMRHFGLANRDLMAHLILTGPAMGAYGARVRRGPPRYSDYVVQVFLLTELGVRQFSVLLNMETGTIAGEQRRVFAYEKIVSTDAKEICLRIDGEHQETVSADNVRRSRKASEKLVFSQEFTLTLDGLQSIKVLVGNVDDGLLDRLREDSQHLLELTRDTSGVNSAIRILENIAADRGEWVQKERERRRRRLLDYQRKRNARRELNGGPTVPPPRPAEPRALSGPHRPYRELSQ